MHLITNVVRRLIWSFSTGNIYRRVRHWTNWINCCWRLRVSALFIFSTDNKKPAWLCRVKGNGMSSIPPVVLMGRLTDSFHSLTNSLSVALIILSMFYICQRISFTERAHHLLKRFCHLEKWFFRRHCMTRCITSMLLCIWVKTACDRAH